MRKASVKVKTRDSTPKTGHVVESVDHASIYIYIERERDVYLSICLSIYLSIYVYIYIYIERERDVPVIGHGNRVRVYSDQV